jgi:dipeptidyl aminopeptidase/acylaminoacyl peptidase
MPTKNVPTPSTVPLIPREVLFGNPEKISPELSPDGRYLAYIAPDSKNVLQVWLRVISQDHDQVLTADPKRGIRSYFWTYEPDKLIYAQDTDGDENYHLYLVDVTTRATKDLTPFAGSRAQVVAVEPRVPYQILAGINKNDPRKHDVYRINLQTAEAVLETENPGNIIGWTTDADLHVRAALAATPDGGHEIWIKDTPQAAWRIVLVLGPDEQGGPLDFSEDGQTLYLVSSLHANAERLLAMEVATGKETVIAEDMEYDVSGVFVHPLTRKIQAVSFYQDKLIWKVLDPSIAADFDVLSKVQKGELHVSRGDLKDRVWLASYIVEDGPVYYYLYDRVSQTATFLFSQRPVLEGLPLASVKSISYVSRDGLTIHGYLTLPSPSPSMGEGWDGGEPPTSILPHKGGGSRGLPTVLLVHGGPWARDHWGFYPIVQWLANRGYAVLQVNYRGSTGYGKKFLNAGNREWAGKMHDDLIDGVDWLVKQGVADPARIAIMGGSYGGYATLVGLTFTPETFACGVDIVGPSNIITLIQTIPPYWEPMKATFARRLGVVDKDEAFMKSRSPLFFVDRIEKPLLIGQGANDPRVKQAESDQIVQAMRKNGKPVEYLVYGDEGHGFARPENRKHFYSRVEQFFAKYLGGRAEPAQNIPGHSGQDR